MRQRLGGFVPLFVLALAVTGLSAQAPAPATPPQQPALAPSEKIPFDSAVTTGTLSNGLTYYIRKNGRPEQRVSLRLAVKAGSVDEENDQQGLAHFLEHMAFNGTKRFKPGELIAALESTGARLGPHVNAYTSFDETVYMFQLPTDKEGLVEKGMQALADFAGGMTLDPKEIEKERGVVIEEWRGGLGAQSRLRDQQIPVLFYESKYAERLPIGKPDVLKSFRPERLRAFYTKWYRPDRMAVVLVGDIEVAEMEALVRKEFGSLPKPDTPPPDRDYVVPLQTELLVKVATDPEATQSSVSLLGKRKRTSEETVGGYRRDLVRRLAFQMLNERFDELSREPDAQFLNAGAYQSGLSPTTSTVGLGASVQEGKIPEGLSAIVVEANRAAQHGFGAAELDRAQKRIVAAFDRAYAERDKTESGAYVQEYINHFLEDEPSPGIEYERKLVQALLPGVTAAEVTAAAKEMFSDASRVILAVSPQKQGLAVPAESELRAVVASAEKVAVTAWNDAAATRELMAEEPDPGTVKDRRELAELGVTVVTFSNGVEAWFKPTDFKNDEVLFSLASPGGSSLAPCEIFVEASLAPAQVQVSGAGGHSAVDLQKLLAGKIASSNPTMSLSHHGISARSNPANIETALQLMHLQFTAPGDDADAFALIKKNLEAAYRNRERDPDAVFSEKIREVNTSGHCTSRPVTLERIAGLNRSAMVSFYKARFANAADFTFFMVGAFKVDDVLPLVGKYVGSLPSTGTASATFKDIGVKFPGQIVREQVVKGQEPRARTVVSFFADPPLEENEQSRVDAATEVLEIALRDILREELGETYGVSVGLAQALPQRGAGSIGISFGGAPDRVDSMVERVMKEVQRLQQEGPSEDLTTRAKETARRAFEVSRRQNGYWLTRLQSSKLLDRDPALILTREQRIDAMTPQNLHEVFEKYFPMNRFTVVTLVPEKK
ncbi:MAG: M16 family metallopeptidase [Vicinamibacterales bacterium]